MTVEVSELIRQYVCVRDYVELLFPILLLHLHYVKAESVFPSQLVRLREVIDLLALDEPLILLQLQGLAGPENIPVVVALSMKEAVVFQDCANQASVCLDKLE